MPDRDEALEARLRSCACPDGGQWRSFAGPAGAVVRRCTRCGGGVPGETVSALREAAAREAAPEPRRGLLGMLPDALPDTALATGAGVAVGLGAVGMSPVAILAGAVGWAMGPAFGRLGRHAAQRWRLWWLRRKLRRVLRRMGDAGGPYRWAGGRVDAGRRPHLAPGVLVRPTANVAPGDAPPMGGLEPPSAPRRPRHEGEGKA